MKAIAYNSLFVLCTVDTSQLHMPVSKLPLSAYPAESIPSALRVRLPQAS